MRKLTPTVCSQQSLVCEDCVYLQVERRLFVEVTLGLKDVVQRFRVRNPKSVFLGSVNIKEAGTSVLDAP